MVEPAWTRAGLRAAGMGEAARKRAIRAGRLVQVGHNRYASAAELTTAAIVAPIGSGTALRGRTAAAAWGLPVLGDLPVEVVVRKGCRRPRLPADVVVRTARHWEVVARDGVLVTDLARTVADVARESPFEVSVPVIDAVRRGGLGSQELAVLLARRAAGGARARRALQFSDRRAGSPLESLLRLLLVMAGLPPTDLQHEVRDRDGRFVARVDLWYPGLVVEADGFAFHRSREDYRGDRRKGQAFARLGLLSLRFSWEDVVGSPEAVVTAVREALAASALPPEVGEHSSRRRRSA